LEILNMPERRIPHSRNVRWRKIRSQLMPVLFFTTTAFAAGWLWQFHGATTHGVGKVKSPRVDLMSPTAGMVVSLPNESGGQWLVYDHVRTGDVIARIQDHELEVSKRMLRQEIEQLVERFDLLASTEEAENDNSLWQDERTELMRLFEWSISGEAQGGDVLTREMIEDDAVGRSSLASGEFDADDSLAALRSMRLTLARRWASLLRRSELMEIQSPITGTLVAVHCWPGQAVPPGGLIATVAADHGQQVIGYVPEYSRVEPQPGMRVSLRTRLLGSTPIDSVVEQVGQRVERIPGHERSGSSLPEWGIPVRIKMPADVPLRPGSLVDLTFHPKDAG
jgi:multidrug resistance efflux pump